MARLCRSEREERKVMNIILITSKCRPDAHLPKFIGTWEFSVVPFSLFALDGSLYYAEDNSATTTELKKFQPVNMDSEKVKSINFKVVIINVMAAVDKINIKDDEIYDSAGFAFKFMEKIDNQVPKFDEVRKLNSLDMMKCLLRETPERAKTKE